MEFQARQSSTFIMNVILIALALSMAIFSFFYFRFKVDFFHYGYILWLFIAFIRLLTYKKYISLLFFQKPALAVNQDYIDDLANEIKYYWKDIQEIYDENDYLYIKLYNQNEYLASIKNPFKRFINGISGSPFKINVDMVNVHPDALLEILDNYSIQAITKEKGTESRS